MKLIDNNWYYQKVNINLITTYQLVRSNFIYVKNLLTMNS